MSRRDRTVGSSPDDDQDALVLQYSPQPLDEDDDPMIDADDEDEDLDVDEDLVRVAWTVERHSPTGEWVFAIFEIGASGEEELLAEVPLDPDTAAEISTALAGSYQDMTGQRVPRQQGDNFAGNGGTLNRWWSKAGNTNTERIRVAVLLALLLLVVAAFVGNVLNDWF